MRKLIFLLLLAFAIASPAQNATKYNVYPDLKPLSNLHPEDSKFWHQVFSESSTNLPLAEYSSIFLRRTETIYSHLHYDKHISPEFLNFLAQFFDRNILHYRELKAKLLTAPKPDNDLLQSCDNILIQQRNWLWEMAGRPEIDRQLVEKILSQAESNPINGEKYSKGSFGGEMMYIALARNSQTPLDVLETLSKEKSFEIRQGLALNPNLPTNILEQLIQDAKATVAAQNQIPETTRDWWIVNNSNRIIEYAKKTLASKPTTSKETLDLFAQSPDYKMRTIVACNTNTSIKTLEHLTNDQIRAVSNAAVRTFMQVKGN